MLFFLIHDLHLVPQLHTPPGLQGDHQLAEHSMGGATRSSVCPEDLQWTQFVLLSSLLVYASHLAPL